jgi:hypothetical protein
LFLCLGQEIPASSAVEYLRIECVEGAKQLNLCSHFAGVGSSYSSRAGECRSKLSLSSKSEKERVETLQVRVHRAQKNFDTWRVFELEGCAEFVKVL